MADTIDQTSVAQDVEPVLEQPVANDAPIDGDEEPEEDAKSKKVTLADLSAKGTALYAKKQYEEAAECFAKAAEMQAELNGEMDPANSDILFLYGRSLFKVGQSKSDVLGGQAGTEQKPGDKKMTKAPKKAVPAPVESEAERITEEGVAIIAGETSDAKKEDGAEEKKPLFQFTGDENFDDSDEDEGAEAEGEEAEEEDDDLAVAFEILDLSRVLFHKQLEGLDQDHVANGKGKEITNGETLSLKHVKERLADTHDLLAEISLENERYPNAIVDTRESLKYKKELYPQESEVIAEAHFKLSLALEFASVTTTQEDGEEQATQKPFDEGLREEAAKELESAIASTKLKLQNKEVELATMNSPEDNEITRAQIVEVKEIIADMEGRLVDLRKPPIDVNAALLDAGGNAMGGILGAALGESSEQTEARIEEAKKSANDLSGLIRKKNKEEPKITAAAPEANGHDSNGTKRKAEESIDAEEESKKAKVEEASAA